MRGQRFRVRLGGVRKWQKVAARSWAREEMDAGCSRRKGRFITLFDFDPVKSISDFDLSEV